MTCKDEEDYPSATSLTLDRIMVEGQELWIQLLEGGEEQFYDAVLPLRGETVRCELFFSHPKGIERHHKDFIEFVKSCVVSSAR